MNISRMGSAWYPAGMTPAEPSVAPLAGAVEADASPARRGRRLSEDRSDVILEAVLELLEE